MRKLLLVFLLISSIVLADKLKIVTLYWKPYDFYEEANGRRVYRGIDLELTLETLRRMGYEFEVEFYPWGRCLEMMKKKSADVIVSAYYKKERTKYLIYPDEPLSYSIFVAFVLKESPIKSEEDIVGRSTSYVKFYYYGRDFESLPVRKIPVSSSDIEFEMLKAKRVDMVIEEYFVGMELVKKHGLSGKVRIIPLPHYLRPIASYAAFAKKPGYEKLAKEFSKVLREVKKELQRKLIEKYVGSAEEYWKLVESFESREEKM